MSRWYTFEEISGQLGIPVKSIYFYHERGDGPRVHKFGKHLRVLDVDLLQWQENQLVKKQNRPGKGGYLMEETMIPKFKLSEEF
jgi:hypothetical protein